MVFVALLAYAGFLISTPLLLLTFPLILGLAFSPLWILAIVDNGQRLREKAFKDENQSSNGQLFDDAYEVVLLKRQISLTRGVLLKLVLIWGSLTLLGSIFLLWSPEASLIKEHSDRTLAPAAFNAFLGILLFVSGRYLIGVSRESSQSQLSCSLGGWWIYGSFGLFTFSLGIFLLNSELSFLFPVLLILATAPLLVLLLEWPIRSINNYYGSGNSPHPPHCPILPLLQWRSAPSTSLQEDLRYQFGHDLSSGTKTLLWKMAFPATLFLGIVLLLGSSLIIVPQGHQGVKLTWGKPSNDVLQPGLHLHQPWPMGSHHLLDTGTIHRLHLEKQHQDDDQLWGAENHEDDLLMVVRSPDARENDWPIEVLAVNAELGYRWTQPHQVFFAHSNPAESLRQKALALLTQRMRKVPLNQWWSTSRSIIEKELIADLQTWVDNNRLGAKVVFFSLPQLHPPTEVDEACEQTIKARFEKETQILQAQAEVARLESSLKDEVARRITVATSQGNILIHRAEARLKGLEGIAKAASVDPELFWNRRRLQSLAEISSDLRKILVLREGKTQVQELDLESHLDVESFNLKLKSKKLRR